jgi:hypothetical protein
MSKEMQVDEEGKGTLILESKPELKVVRGRIIRLGYSNTNGRPYISIRRDNGKESGGFIDGMKDSEVGGTELMNNQEKYL